MTKREVLTRFVLYAVVAAAVTAILDVTLVTVGLGWIAWVLDVAFASGLVVLTIGCFAPNSPIFGRVIDGSGVHEAVVALTFDDGPSPDTTPRVLDALRDAGARATFFVLGKHAEKHPELIERMVREGHEVASHGWTHGILVFASPAQITAELVRTQRLLERLGVPTVRFFRAPHGFRNPAVVGVCRRLGYRVVGWTKGVFDTARPGVDSIVSRATRGLRPGAILLLHDADGSGTDDRCQTADALPAILDGVATAGLRTVGISEFAALSPGRQVSWKRLALVIVAVAAVVTIAFQRADRKQILDAWQVFRTLSIPLVVAALAANVVSVWFKATVWKASLDTIPGHPRFRYAQVVPAIFVGFLLNSMLVARLGEVGRMFVLRRRVSKDSGVTIPMSTIAGTLVMEQVILGITLVMIVVGMMVLLPNVPAAVSDGVIALVGAVGVLTAAVIAVEAFARWRRRRRPLEPGDEPAARTWRTLLRNAEALINEMSRGQRLLRHPGRTLWSLAGGLISWAAQVFGIWLTLKAFAIDSHTLGAAAVVFVASNVVGLVQVTPGNVGVFQGTVALALNGTYNIPFTTGVTFGIGLQVIEVVLGAGLGFVFLSREGLSLGEVRRGMSAAVSEAEREAIAVPRLVPNRDERRRLVV